MHPSRFGPKAACLAFTLFLGWSAGSLSAQPTGGQVVAGSASIASGPGGVTITQTSGRAIINWQDFSLGVGDFARFVQPDAASATLNRVISGLPSSLAGSLEANGQVFLINPNGVLIGAGARIDTAGFLASTLDVANDAFLAGGDLNFTGDSTAAVVNLGTINALEGDIFLIAQRVENHGTLTAAKGTAGLAAGSEILLTTGGAERVFVQAVSAPGTVANSATITAATAELKAAGGNAYALAIANTGVVRATGSAVRDGQLWLVASGESTVTNAGTLDVSSTTGAGGQVVVTAGRVLLDDGSRINATGATGGGQVYVGGGWQGKDAAIANASAVVLQAGAAIDAGATAGGDGGEVVLWSDDYTGFFGRITAQGGAQGGDGGRVETSSHGVLQAAGTVDISAAHGRTGSWLLDPWSVTIAHTGVTGTAFADPFNPTATSVILASSVSSALDSGANVTITTGTTGGTGGDINVNAPISWSANSTLTLQAYVDVNVNADITATGDTAGLVITPNSPSNSFGGEFTLNNRARITLSGATPSLTIAGQAYTIINSLGVAGDATSAPVTPSLQGLAAAANLGGRYALGSDIDASDTATWNSGLGFTPIGTAGAPFSGTFEGLGHTITGLTIARSDTDNVGLFGYLSGAVRRVGLLEVSVLGKNSVGGLAGTINDFGGIYLGYVGGTVTGSAGFIPIALPGETSAILPPSSGGENVGGLAGSNGGQIGSSYAFATVSGVKNVGGLIGLNGPADPEDHTGSYPSIGEIRESYATGDVSGTDNVGGLVGASYAVNDNLAVSVIKYVYATGSVTGTTNVGGVVGITRDTDLLESYATGSVTGTTNVGGLVGENIVSHTGIDGIAAGYWNSETTGQSAAVGLDNGYTNYTSSLTSAQMLQMSSFAAFQNLTDTGGNGGLFAHWRIYEGHTMPLLQVFLFPVTLTATSATKTYDGASYAGANGFTYSLPGVEPAFGGTATYGGTGQSAVNAGTYTRTLSGFYSEQQGYDIIYAPGTLTINKANLVLTGTRVYDGTTTFGSSYLTATGVAGQTFTVTGTGATGNLTTKNVQTNQTLASVTGLSLGTSSNGGVAGNYNALAVTNSSVSVTPLALTLTGFASNNKVYDGNTTAVVATPGTLTGVISGDTVGFSYTGATFDTKNVGTDKTVTLNGVTLTGSGDEQNYSFTAVTTDLSDITPATLTYTADLVDRTYGTANPTLTGSVTGYATGETTANATTGTATFTTTATTTSNVGTYAINGSGLTANNGNYVFVQAAGNATALTINKADLVLSGTRVYDGTTIFAGNLLTATGVLGETFTLTGAGASGNLSSKHVQTNQALVSVGGLTLGTSSNSGLASNYNALAVTNSQVSVTPAALTVTANNASKTYGQTVTFAGTEFTSTGLVSGEAIGSVSLASNGAGATAGVASSPYAITAVSVTGGTFTATDYTISYVNGALTVTPVALTITASNASKTYGQTVTFAGTEFTSSGLQNSETVGSVTLASSGAGATAGVAGSPYAITALGATGGTFAAANYTISYVDGALTINKANLVLGGTRVYDGTTTFGGSYLTATGVNGETFTVTGSGASGNLATKHVQTNQALASVGGLNLGTSGNGGLASNYNALSVTGSQVSVTPAALTVTANNASKVYGQTMTFAGTEFTNSGLVTGDTIGGVSLASSGAMATASVVGSPYVITAASATGGTFAATDYTISYVNGALTVTPASLSITANNASKTYGQTTTFDGSEFTSVGLQNSETIGSVSLASGGAVATAGVASSPYAITATAATGGTFNAANYTLSYINGSLTVTPANLVLSGTRVYDGTTLFAGGNLTATGVNGEIFMVTGSGASGNLATKHVQTNQALASVGGLTLGTSGNGGLASNYNTLAVTGSQVSVTPAALTVTANNASKVYGQTLTFAGTEFTNSGLVTGDTIGSVSLASSGAVATAGVAGSPYAITATSATGGTFAASDYTISYVDGVLTVTPAALTITAKNATKTYGQTTTFTGAEFTSSGLVNGETIGSVSLASAGAGALAGVAGSPYAIAPSVATGGTFSAANYMLSYVNGALTITPAALTITANNASKTFGQTMTFAGAEFTATGLQNGETVGSVTLASGGAVATATVAGSPYAITPSAATGGTFSAANYALSYANGVLTVTDVVAPPPVANVPLTITADNKTKIYGAPLPAFTATFAGFINGDTSASVTGLQFSSTATISSNVGTYTITPFGATAPSYYVVGYVPGVLTINPAQLTITANNITRQFGETTPGFTANYTGFVNGDTASVVSGLTFGTAATSSPDDFTIIPGGALASNYAIIYINGLLHIVMPVVPVGAEELPVVVIGGEPLVTPNFAVVEQNNQLVFVSVSGSGEPDEQLAITLGEATSLPALANDPANPGIAGLGALNEPNFGSFELVASLDGGRPDSSQASEPGLFRESSVNMGGFNVVYHEALDDARQQEVDNTALGSSYREFSDADDPQVNLVRTKVERKPAGTSSGPSS